MSFVSHYFNLLHRLRLPAVLFVSAAGGLLTFVYFDLSDQGDNAEHSDSAVPSSAVQSWPEMPAEVDSDWSCFSSISGDQKPGHPGFAENFRFAGTFFLSGAGNIAVCKAVLSVKSEGRQVIASVGDEIAGVVVAKISEDSVELRCGDEVAELHLNFSVSEGGDAKEVSGGDKVDSGEERSCRFGKLIAENSWELDRKTLIGYYNELLDEPERLLSVFDSLKPLYDGNGINGYKLGIEGESDFFEEIGLKEGDVIKKVNSLKMTSRRRAEFFIKQFVINKLSAIVIDVERDGKPKRLVYQVR